MASRKQRPQALGPVTAADVIAFIEQVCFVPEGKFVGHPLKLQDWQKDILRLIYDNVLEAEMTDALGALRTGARGDFG